MDILIKNAIILHKGSPYHLQKKDLLIADGKIQEIGDNIAVGDTVKILSGNKLYCTIGLCDIGTQSGEPGHEHRETIHSLTTAALKGGFTTLFVSPNNSPATQTRADIRYLKNHPDRQHVEIHAIGALSQDLKGKDINEYMDMAAEGVKVVSDGLLGVQSVGLLDRSMLYAWNAGISLLLFPDNIELSHGGQMHEGAVSTSLGLKGVPDVAETQFVQRDISMLSYNSGHIIEHGISSAVSVQMIRKAVSEGVHINATVPYLNLLFSDASMTDFDTNLKVHPVLRTDADRLALIEGLKNDTINAICSNHVPLDTEDKDLEFSYAQFGAMGLETCLPALMDGLAGQLNIEIIADKLTRGPRSLFNLDIPDIEIGAEAELCVFDTQSAYLFSKNNLASLCENNPFINQTMHTQVKATIIGNNIFEL